jgi:hypothetical protein
MLDKEYLDPSAFQTVGPHEVIAKIARHNSSIMYLVRRQRINMATNGANSIILKKAIDTNNILHFAEDNGLFTLEQIKLGESHSIRSCWWLNQGDIDEVLAVNAELLSCLKTDSF